MKHHTRTARAFRGFTLIESLVFLFLFALISAVFFETYTVGTRLIIESKNRLGATALANQKMEIIRSIEYDTIGTTTGIPAGDLTENETISVNTVQYHVHTFVQYADDVFDGTVASGPPDAIPTDYKRVRVTVSWGAQGPDQTVVIFGNFSPNGIEASSGGGVFSVNVLDATGSGISGVSVHIVNSADGVNLTTTTDSTGNVTLPGAPAATEGYEVTLSKTGYYGAMTYPPYPTSSFAPVDVHGSVVADTLNQKTMVIDQNIDLTLKTEDPFGTSIPTIAYTITGGRVLGTDPSDGSTVTEFSQSGTTDASGEENFTDESYGQYTVDITGGADYDFWKLSPEGVAPTVYDAPPASSTTLKAILLDRHIGSAKILVKNQADGSALPGAEVRLTNATLPYDATVTADQYGIAYFPTALPALLDGTYDIEVSLTGFVNETDTLTVSGALETKTINLIAN